MDGPDVPHVPAPPAGRLADRRLRGSPWLRPGVERADAECERARTAWRSVPPLPLGGRLVLLAGRGAVRRSCRECADAIGRSDEVAQPWSGTSGQPPRDDLPAAREGIGGG